MIWMCFGKLFLRSEDSYILRVRDLEVLESNIKFEPIQVGIERTENLIPSGSRVVTNDKTIYL